MKIAAALVVGAAAATGLCAAQLPLSTVFITVPSQGVPFTSTVSACETVSAFAVVAVPNGTFFPGTTTVYLPPQASGTTSTYIDYESNLTEVIVASPLPGTCADLALPSEATATVNPSPASPSSSSSAKVCPLEGCSAGVDKAAQQVIDLINEVAIASQKLQSAAKLIGGKRTRGVEARFDPLTDVIPPLEDIASTLTFGLPTIKALPAFPAGCNSDTIVVALIDFVRIHQALLEIFIGRSGLLSFSFVENNPEHAVRTDAAQKFPNPIGVAIAGALRAIETGVDALAFSLIGLIPTRQSCLKQQQASIDKTLKDAINAYQS
ncbi:uncharacterized protein F4822DRAFT_428194 [Hypoxylon trugodes]|uniref:uncharacterized protein n=1 Tax=Hypoxylon trugodes TaxID=326681 RepID=UPI0021913B88|nr:uncharacterized protein F4822DRAFT_428194 [Hypoxylon trugodes]KAI1389853.1 hypothetical protein F4822DRAFT_428194 [Hypoxylon trugodes]